MSEQQRTAVAPEPPVLDSFFSFEVGDVTGTHRSQVDDMQASLPAGAAAKALVARLSLPENVPWALRDDATGALLDDRLPIGEQVEPGAALTVTPKTHLG